MNTSNVCHDWAFSLVNQVANAIQRGENHYASKHPTHGFQVILDLGNVTPQRCGTYSQQRFYAVSLAQGIVRSQLQQNV